MFKRPIFEPILKRLNSKNTDFIQVLVGPRQVGKTTLCEQIIQAITDFDCIYVTADEAESGSGEHWLEQSWSLARLKLKTRPVILFIDEIQKIKQWSTLVKKLWDEDKRKNTALKIVLLGSSPLLIQKGLNESLAGRFELTRITHWSYSEMKAAFNVSLDEYIYFGGYPGAAGLIKDESRWRAYIRDALIEPTVTKDILMLNRVDKPALLRQLFFLGCESSGQILSYNKMLGTLNDAGNTTTLSHYLKLLSGAGMLTGLEKYAKKMIRSRESKPKLQVLNTGLMSAASQEDFESARNNSARWGRYVESAVGAHLINSCAAQHLNCHYWNHSSWEVDFVISSNHKALGIEVRSGHKPSATSGMKKFQAAFPDISVIMIGGQGLPLEDFLSMDPSELLA